MLLAGSAGPTLVQSAYKLIAAAGSGEVNPDGSSGVPEGISTWEEYYDYLTTHHAGTTAADTLALMDLAKHNSGNITEQAHHDAPLTFGLSLSKTLGDRWSLETGLQYTLLRSTFTMGSGTNHISRRQTVGYVGLPLRLSYRFADVGRRLSAYGSAGLTLHVPAGGRSREYLVTDSVALPTGTTHLSVPFGWSVSANVGLQYRLTPGLSLYLEPTVGYHFPTGGSVSTSWTARPLTFSVPLGVRFTW